VTATATEGYGSAAAVDFAPDGTVQAQFQVPVDAYTAPIGKLFVTVEPTGAGQQPTGPVVMQSA